MWVVFDCAVATYRYLNRGILRYAMRSGVTAAASIVFEGLLEAPLFYKSLANGCSFFSQKVEEPRF